MLRYYLLKKISLEKELPIILFSILLNIDPPVSPVLFQGLNEDMGKIKNTRGL